MKDHFPDINAVKIPLVVDKNILTLFEWLVNLGDGSFYFTVRAYKLNEIPRTDNRVFNRSTFERYAIIGKIYYFLNCGRIKKDSRYSAHYFVVTNIKDVIKLIIPFLKISN